jgi:hypothetical protein
VFELFAAVTTHLNERVSEYLPLILSPLHRVTEVEELRDSGAILCHGGGAVVGVVVEEGCCVAAVVAIG